MEDSLIDMFLKFCGDFRGDMDIYFPLVGFIVFYL